MDHKKYLSIIGEKGGAVKSKRKADACRANAKRPRKRTHKTKSCAIKPGLK